MLSLITLSLSVIMSMTLSDIYQALMCEQSVVRIINVNPDCLRKTISKIPVEIRLAPAQNSSNNVFIVSTNPDLYILQRDDRLRVGRMNKGILIIQDSLDVMVINDERMLQGTSDVPMHDINSWAMEHDYHNSVGSTVAIFKEHQRAGNSEFRDNVRTLCKKSKVNEDAIEHIVKNAVFKKHTGKWIAGVSAEVARGNIYRSLSLKIKSRTYTEQAPKILLILYV